jgi:hypothetical protein
MLSVGLRVETSVMAGPWHKLSIPNAIRASLPAPSAPAWQSPLRCPEVLVVLWDHKGEFLADAPHLWRWCYPNRAAVPSNRGTCTVPTATREPVDGGETLTPNEPVGQPLRSSATARRPRPNSAPCRNPSLKGIVPHEACCVILGRGIGTSAPRKGKVFDARRMQQSRKAIISFNAARLVVNPILSVALSGVFLLSRPRPHPHGRVFDGDDIFELRRPGQITASTFYPEIASSRVGRGNRRFSYSSGSP